MVGNDHTLTIEGWCHTCRCFPDFCDISRHHCKAKHGLEDDLDFHECHRWSCTHGRCWKCDGCWCMEDE